PDGCLNWRWPRVCPPEPVVAHVPGALCTDEAVVRHTGTLSTGGPCSARLCVQAGFAGAVNGDKVEGDALAGALVLSGTEATLRNRLPALGASSLDEPLHQLVPAASQAGEREQGLHRLGSLEDGLERQTAGSEH